jgi:uncharacterized membrane protein YcaP (DUF421 family)
MDSVFKAVAIYLLLWVVIRVSGRRTLAQMTTFDLILLLIIGSATQRALIGQDYSLTTAFIVVTTLVSLNVGMSLMEVGSRRMAKLLKGTPTILVEHGHKLEGRMRRARVTEEEIREAARHDHGIERLEQIKFAVLEASGKISIIPAEQKTS